MPHIVISFRSSDSSAIAQRVGERLAAHYGRDAVRLDGADFFAKDTPSGDVLLVVIGPRWLGPIVEGRSAIHHGSDPVRNRIETALRKGTTIVPVLVEGARAPRPVDVPDSLKDLVARQAVEINAGRDFARHTDQLIAAIDGHLQIRNIEGKPMPGATGAALPPAPLAAAQTVEAACPAAPAAPIAPAIDKLAYDRTMPEYWLHHVAVDRKLAQGDAPLVVVSYASEDLCWVDDLQAFIDPKIEQLRDPSGQAYQLWQFSDARRGTAPGDEFPTVVAEKMWRCRVALIVLSKDYFSSRYCRQIELPFLMWRREHHGLLCMPLRLGALPADRVRLPAYASPPRNLFLDDLIDDRQAPANFAASPHRDFTLKQLKEQGFESEIESRFDGIARLVVDFLKKRHAAIDD
jgi:hypothetical protein